MAALTEFAIIVLFLVIVPGFTLKVSASDSIRNQNVPQRRLERSIKVSEEFKKAAVDSHNKARFNVNPSATNMQKMVWNDDLAVTAQNYGDTCIWGHNDKRTEDTQNKIWTPKDVGENLYYTTAKLTDVEVMKLAVEKWDAEKKDYTYETGTCAENEVCGHYTQVVWHESVYVGCGISYCPGNKKMITCNYGPAGNWIGEAPYATSGNPSKSNEKSKTGYLVNKKPINVLPPSKSSSSSVKPVPSTTNKVIYSCSFERTLCRMTQPKNLQLKWKHTSGGPTKAGSRSKYVYIGGEGITKVDSVAVLYLPLNLKAGVYCIGLGFKFQSQNRGKLEIGAGRSVIYSIDDKYAGKWTRFNIQISAKGGGPKLHMKGTLFKNTNSYIAMDDLRIQEGNCQRRSS